MDEGPVVKAVLHIEGVVQGVGFRPFVARLARENGLAGTVQNVLGHVEAEVTGPGEAVAAFTRELETRKPAGSLISCLSCCTEPLPEGAALPSGFAILESGGEIVVQPPGKELRTLSLMSGGEKTMTCVALLLALFKTRPSPFCILDEVDAALDEPNIVRLMEVITQFLDKTQFIIISHSKKTISYAHTIYGVTMQDSGISKQVSVRFEDVNEDGEIESLGIKLFPDDTRSAG